MILRRDMLAGLVATGLLPRAALAATGDVLTAKVMLESGRLLVAVGIKGEGPFIFMIDTGGALGLIQNSLAERLRLPMVGHSAMRGVGGSDVLPLYRATDVVIGGTMRQSVVGFNGIDTTGFGKDVMGTIAAGLITARDTELDFDAGELRVYPHGQSSRSGYEKADATIVHKSGENASAYILADAVLDGQRYRFLLDTGSPRALTLYPDAVRRSGLWSDDRRYAPFQPYGVGGGGENGRIVRASSFRIGDLSVERPLVTLFGGSPGKTVPADGIMGLPMIRCFNLAIDAGRREMWVKRSRIALPDDNYRLAGVWLTPDGQDAVVADVAPGSPGAVAGLRKGDRVVGHGFTKVRQAIDAPAGSEVKLPITRGAEQFNATLKIAPYL